MTDTPNLGLPFIEGSQAQKHVTHNEALRILDAAIQIAVLDLTRTSPPSSPAEGERHVVAFGATGAWAGQANAIATWQDGAWAFLMPRTGWCIWSVADDVIFVFDGTHWRDLRDLPVTLDNLPFMSASTPPRVRPTCSASSPTRRCSPRLPQPMAAAATRGCRSPRKARRKPRRCFSPTRFPGAPNSA